MLLELIEKTIDAIMAIIPRKQPSQALAKNAKLVAHRGAHNINAGIIENTRQAFQQAQILGCFGIEFDVQTTKDNILVVHHDPTLERLWGHNNAIADLSFEELRSLAPEVVALEEVVREFGGRIHLFIELKSPFQNEQALIAILKDIIPCQDYHIISLNALTLAALKRLPSDALMLVPVHNNVGAFCSISLNKHYGGVLGHYLLLTNKKIKGLQQANQQCGVGFVDSRFSLYRELNRGVDWMFTNKAAQVRTYLDELLE